MTDDKREKGRPLRGVYEKHSEACRADEAYRKDHSLLMQILALPEGAEGSIDTVEGARVVTGLLGMLMSAWHGNEGAAYILTSAGSPSSAASLKPWKDWAILRLFDRIGSKLNIRQFARMLAAENERLPEEERWGPRGTTNPMTMDAYIRRLLNRRAKRKE